MPETRRDKKIIAAMKKQITTLQLLRNERSKKTAT